METKLTKNRMSRRDFLKQTGILVGAAALASCAAPEAPPPQIIKETVEVEVPVEVIKEVEVEVDVTAEPVILEPATLDVWINWGGIWQEAIEQIVASFLDKYPQMSVELLPGQSGTEGMTKFLAAVAAGNPPHLYTVHASDGAMLTGRGVLLPLDGYLSTSRVSPDDFFEEQLALYIHEGKIHGLPSIEGAAGQAIAWNKAHFAEVGLDPEVSPKTHADIEMMAEQLDIFDAVGNVIRFGFDPLDARGGSLIDWWFEREWYDVNTNQLNVNSPDMVWGAEWVADFVKRMGPEKRTAFRQEYSRYTGSPKSGFVQEAQSMIMSAYYMPGELARLAPELEVGYDWVPTLDNKKVTTIRGWFWAMPRGCADPDAAWAFMENATSIEAAFTIFNLAGGYPSYRPFLELADFSRIPGLQWFIDSPFNADEFYIAPPLPISSDEVDDRIDEGLEEMIFGDLGGQEMLDRVQGEVQKLIDQAIEALEA